MRRTAKMVLVVGALMVVGSTTAAAQDRGEFQQWTAVLASAPTQPAAPGLSFWLDVHARRGSAGTVLLLRPGIGVEVTSWLALFAGYAWIPTFDDATGNASHEHRIWEQVTLKHRFADFGVALQSRTRFEQRFSENGSDVGLRLRQFVRANWRPSEEFPLGIAFWDELFMGLTETDWGTPTGIDQNRVFLGPFLQMADWARLEMGYLFVYLDRGLSDTYGHVLAVNFFASPRPQPAATPEDE